MRSEGRPKSTDSTSTRTACIARWRSVVVTKLWLCLLLAALVCPFESQADEDDCKSGAAIGLLRCFDPKLAELRKQLDQSYNRVLDKMPNASSFDDRKTAEQLRKSQSAWEAYAKENCAFIGGLRGGSNAWVSVFATQCLIREIQSRIDFLEHLPSGG
jgi:uncharacterized protein YecT (DUF1311 family)